ncbi:MAG: ATP-binding protein [Elusimicrobiota bacterium]
MLKVLIIGGNLFAVLVTFLLAIIVFNRNIEPKLNKSFVFLNFSIGMWCLGAFFINLLSDFPNFILNVHRFCYIFGIILPLLSIHFAYTMRNEIWNNWSRKAVYAVTGILLVFLPTSLFIKGLVNVKGSTLVQSDPGIIYYIFFLSIALGCGYCIFLLYDGMKSAIGIRRDQFKFVFLGYLLFYIGYGIYFATIFGLINVFAPAGYLIGLGSIVLFYSIVKHRLMEINTVLTVGTIFIIVYGLILAVSIFIAISGEKYFAQLLGERWWIGFFIFGVVLAYIGQIIYHYLRNKAEERLIRKHRQYYESLLKASKEMIFVRDIKSIRESVVDILTKEINISHVRFFEYNEERVQYELVASRGIERRYQSGKALNDEHHLIKLLNRERNPLVIEDLDRFVLNKYQIDYDEVYKEIRALGASIVLPRFSNKRLEGFITLGAKINKELYTKYDLNVLVTLINQVSLAIENAEFFERIKEHEMHLIQTAKLSTLGEMAAGFAHQINNPLGTVVGAADLCSLKFPRFLDRIEKEGLSSELRQEFTDWQIKNIEIIKKMAFRIAHIIQGIMGFAKPGDFQRENLLEIINEGLNMIPSKKFNDFKINVIKSIEPGLSPVLVKAIDIQQVIMNLCINAIEAMANDRGGTITINAQDSMSRLGFVEMKISDTGHGIPDNIKNKIFDLFFTTKGSQGTGMGVSLVHRMVTDNRGDIEVASKEGEGTTFTVYLPIYKDKQEK